VFIGALGEFGGTFGVHIATIATSYGLDVEDELAAILPADADGLEQGSPREDPSSFLSAPGIRDPLRLSSRPSCKARTDPSS